MIMFDVVNCSDGYQRWTILIHLLAEMPYSMPLTQLHGCAPGSVYSSHLVGKMVIPIF